MISKIEDTIPNNITILYYILDVFFLSCKLYISYLLLFYVPLPNDKQIPRKQHTQKTLSSQDLILLVSDC